MLCHAYARWVAGRRHAKMTRLKKWEALRVEPGVVHVHPLGDLIEHDTDGPDCECHPQPEHVPNPNGPDGWLYIHSSLDGREAHE